MEGVGNARSGGRGDEARHESPRWARLELADFIGLDVCVDIMHVLLDGLGDPKYRFLPAAQEIRRPAGLGSGGRGGRGFYTYS